MRTVLLLLTVLVLSACGAASGDDGGDGGDGGDGRTASDDLVFTHDGGCGDAFFYAVTADERFAVVVSVEAHDRSASGPTTIEVDLADDAASGTLWEGRNLLERMCNDVLIDSEITEQVPLAAGTGRITLDPPADPGGFVTGRLVLRDVETRDGRELPDLDVTTEYIGLYAG